MPEDVTLRDYVEKCLEVQDGKIEHNASYTKQHFALNEQAIQKAEESMIIRLEGMNRFREQIEKERADYVTKDTVRWILGVLVIPIILAIIALIKG